MTRHTYFVAHGGVAQGVGFRFFAKQKAQQHGVTGWCRNTPGNKVEGEAQGEDDALDRFLTDVGRGPAGATVARLTTEDRGVVQGDSGFSVRH